MNWIKDVEDAAEARDTARLDAMAADETLHPAIRQQARHARFQLRHDLLEPARILEGAIVHNVDGNFIGVVHKNVPLSALEVTDAQAAELKAAARRLDMKYRTRVVCDLTVRAGRVVALKVLSKSPSGRADAAGVARLG